MRPSFRRFKGASFLEYAIFLGLLALFAFVMAPHLFAPAKPSIEPFSSKESFSEADDLNKAPVTTAEETPLEETAPKETSLPSEPTDLTFLWVILGAAGTAGVLIPATSLARHQKAAFDKKKEEANATKAALKARYAAAVKRHQGIEQEYDAYLVDLQEIFKRPALNDVSIPETADFVETFAATGRSGNLPALPALSDAAIKEYEERVSALSRTWTLASSNATKMGLGIFNAQEQRKVRQASQLLNMALDEGASEFERAQAYQQVQKLIEGLLVITPKLKLHIESKVRKAITA